MRAITIDTEKCKKDGICAQVCPMRYIQGKVGEVPTARESNSTFCIACGQCMAFCPHQAITIEGLEQKHATPIDRKLLPSAQATSLLLQSRRSIRIFKDTPVDKNELSAIFTDASFAPTAKNKRAIRFITLANREQVQKLGDTLSLCYKEDIAKNPSSPNVALYKTLSGNWDKGIDIIFRGAPNLVLLAAPQSWEWAAIDCAIAATYVEIAAHARNIGACWAGFVVSTANSFAPVRELLQLQDGEAIYAGQMLGLPKIRPNATAPREPYAVTWFE